MANDLTLDIECPVCEKQQDVTVRRSIDAATDPELRVALYNGTLNMFNCAACGHAANVDVDLLYVDAKSGCLVQYYPFQYLKDDDFVGDMFTHQGRLVNPGARADEEFTVDAAHVVFDVGELVRYIYFRERLYVLKGYLEAN